ncbi:MAG: winged helix-turn-helix transcriptional regulator [Bacillota bacterium]|nr:winged helix-turn-helix transcriptional regulator [Bacillota bacterium]
MSGLNENEKKIIEFVLNNKEITNKQAVELIGLSPAWVRKIFIDLQDKGMIEARGNGRGRKYILPE